MFEFGVAFKRNFGTAPTNHCAESRGTPWPLGRLDQLGETGGAAFAARAGQSIRMPHWKSGARISLRTGVSGLTSDGGALNEKFPEDQCKPRTTAEQRCSRDTAEP